MKFKYYIITEHGVVMGTDDVAQVEIWREDDLNYVIDAENGILLSSENEAFDIHDIAEEMQ